MSHRRPAIFTWSPFISVIFLWMGPNIRLNKVLKGLDDSQADQQNLNLGILTNLGGLGFHHCVSFPVSARGMNSTAELKGLHVQKGEKKGNDFQKTQRNQDKVGCGFERDEDLICIGFRYSVFKAQAQCGSRRGNKSQLTGLALYRHPREPGEPCPRPVCLSCSGLTPGIGLQQGHMLMLSWLVDISQCWEVKNNTIANNACLLMHKHVLHTDTSNPAAINPATPTDRALPSACPGRAGAISRTPSLKESSVSGGLVPNPVKYPGMYPHGKYIFFPVKCLKSCLYFGLWHYLATRNISLIIA